MSRTSRTLALVALVQLIALPTAEAQAPEAIYYPGGLAFETPAVDYEGISITVSGPDGIVFTEQFGAGEAPAMALEDTLGDSLPDGVYSYELRIAPRLADTTRQLLSEARQAGDETLAAKLRLAGHLPDESALVRSGFFTVANGEIVSPEQKEPRQAVRAASSAGTLGVAEEQVVGVSAADFVVNDDLIVQGSACIGFDCINGENFGFDTLRLKENNLRIKFEDTSNTPGFPTTDWQLTANDSFGGGASKFSIEDIDGGRVPFTIRANAPSNSLFVDTAGRVGLGTAVPVLPLQIASGNSPGVRLEQNNSSGFTPQTWDIVGNEANFFVRDTTNGSQLPFRIQPGAGTNTLFLNNNGMVGLRTNTPMAPLHLKGDAVGTGNDDMFLMQTSGGSRILAENTAGGPNTASSGTDWEMTFGASTFLINAVDGDTQEMRLFPSGQFEIYNTAGRILLLSSNGNLDVEGTVTANSPAIPDYVFEADYPLRSLAEVADFVAREKHLPGVPSAQDIADNGGKGRF